MKKPAEIDEQIWSYLDGSCSAAEKAAVDAKINEDRIWREKFDELQQLNSGLKRVEPEQPSSDFSTRVMNALKTEHTLLPARKYIHSYIIHGLAFFFILIILVGICQAIYSDSEKQKILEFTQPGINYNSIINRNTIFIIIAINITLALAIADKILRKRIYF